MKLKRLKLSPQKFRDAAIGEFLPGICSGVVSSWLRGKTAKEFYHDIKQHAGENWLADMIPPRSIDRIKGVVKDTNWLNMEWVVDTIAEEHKDIAILILTSPSVKSEMELQIAALKRTLAA